MEFKGTKGKWEKRKNTIFIEKTYNKIATVSVQKTKWLDNDEIDEKMEANALLMSKSLELLEKLNYLVENDYIANKKNVDEVKKLIKESTEL